MGIGSVIAAIRYTVGSNAYGYKALGDVFVFIFFGLVSVVGGYMLFAKEINHVTYLPALTIGFLSTAVLNLNNMRDRISDEKANKITLAVKLGDSRVKMYHTILILLAIVFSSLFAILYYTSPFNFIFTITYIPLFLHLRKVFSNTNPKLLDPELKKIAFTTVFMSILMGIGHLF